MQKITYDSAPSFAEEMDLRDPLRSYRAQFFLPTRSKGQTIFYFLGNSLGPQPRSAQEYVSRVVRDWATRSVEAYFQGDEPWLSYADHFTKPTAEILGALPHEIAVMNALTVNLHLMLTSFYRPTSDRFKILVEERPFPSDLYALSSHVSLHGHDPARAIIRCKPRPGEYTLRTEDIESEIQRNGPSIALILFGGVNYHTGQAFEMKRLTEAGHKAGCVVGFDLAHAAGNIPLSLHSWGCDFAVWCSYKYLNAGPGGPGGCFVHEKHHSRTDMPRLAGWWGEETQERFAMRPGFTPAPGAGGWHVSSPPVPMLAAYRAAINLFAQAGMEQLRTKSVALTGYLEFLLRQLEPNALSIITPGDPLQRGAQLSLRTRERGHQLFQKLLDRGVLCDYREPDVIRMAPAPFYNTYGEVLASVRILSSILRESG
jgi:kynureninase